MGLFSKIGEMFRRMKTPKLEAGNNIQNQYNNTNNYMQNSYTMRVSNDGEEEYYKVEENRLRKLDRDKKEITGDLAGYYILKKELQN